MTVPSLPISLNGNIVAEFGGPGNLRSYLRTAGYVPNHPVNSSVPSSGTIKISDMAGSTRVFASSTSLEQKKTYTKTSTKGPKFRYYWGSYVGPTALTPTSAIPPNVTMGNVSTANVMGISGSNLTQATCVGIYDTNDASNPVTSYVVFTGNLVNWAWTSVTANGVSMTRSTTDTPEGTYISANNITYWSKSGFNANNGFFYANSSGTKTYTYNVDPV